MADRFDGVNIAPKEDLVDLDKVCAANEVSCRLVRNGFEMFYGSFGVAKEGSSRLRRRRILRFLWSMLTFWRRRMGSILIQLVGNFNECSWRKIQIRFLIVFFFIYVFYTISTEIADILDGAKSGWFRWRRILLFWWSVLISRRRRIRSIWLEIADDTNEGSWFRRNCCIFTNAEGQSIFTGTSGKTVSFLRSWTSSAWPGALKSVGFM